MQTLKSLYGCVVALALAGVLAGAPSVALGEPIFPFDVHETTLENGLKVIVVPYDSPGVVTYITVVRTGSRNEVEPGHSGFAHFFEHMMFRGTEKYSSEAYSGELKRLGADSNASTSDDWTRYYITGPSSEIGTMIEIESDRFLNLSYSEDGFRTEAKAVLGEYNKNASNPFRLMNERLRDLAFQQHTYKHTTMGFVADIEAMPDYYDYSLGFFDRFYRPGNCIVLAVGDVDPEAFFASIALKYGSWRAGYEPASIPAEPAPVGPRRERIDWPNPTRPYLMMGYSSPAFSSRSPDSAALDVLSQLLFSNTAPLYQKLVIEDQWVDVISGGLADHRDPYLFTITARVKSEDLLGPVEAAIGEAVTVLKDRPVEEARLETIKSHLRYSFALGLASPASVAFTIAHYLSLTGSVNTINEIYERYEEVTAADIQAIARKVFQATHETVVTLSHGASAATSGVGG